MHLFVLTLILSLVLGFLGMNTRLGFWGNFFASLLLTPVVGLLLVIAASPRQPS